MSTPGDSSQTNYQAVRYGLSPHGITGNPAHQCRTARISHLSSNEHRGTSQVCQLSLEHHKQITTCSPSQTPTRTCPPLQDSLRTVIRRGTGPHSVRASLSHSKTCTGPVPHSLVTCTLQGVKRRNKEHCEFPAPIKTPPLARNLRTIT